MKQKIIYYENELTDDFSGFEREEVPIDQNYPYQRSILWKCIAAILYVFLRPLVYLYLKFYLHLKIVNRGILKKYEEGYFMYANHTHVPADGFLPAIIAYPKRVHILVTSENLSVKGTKNLMAMLGALPIPNHFSGMRNFKMYMQELIQKKRAIMIYPEAHIWPYYTHIRPFEAVSFSYPVTEKKAVFSYTVTYQKKWFGLQMVCYVDGPFYPPKELEKKEAMSALRDQVYMTMVKRSENSNYEKIKYYKKESEKK